MFGKELFLPPWSSPVESLSLELQSVLGKGTVTPVSSRGVVSLELLSVLGEELLPPSSLVELAVS